MFIQLWMFISNLWRHGPLFPSLAVGFILFVCGLTLTFQQWRSLSKATCKAVLTWLTNLKTFTSGLPFCLFGMMRQDQKEGHSWTFAWQVDEHRDVRFSVLKFFLANCPSLNGQFSPQQSTHRTFVLWLAWHTSCFRGKVSSVCCQATIIPSGCTVDVVIFNLCLLRALIWFGLFSLLVCKWGFHYGFYLPPNGNGSILSQQAWR